MPRKARARRYEEHECAHCHRLFDAVRDDVKTCGPRCRVAFNRDKKAATKARARKRMVLSIILKCRDCGTEYDVMATTKCPVCGCWEHVPRS